MNDQMEMEFEYENKKQFSDIKVPELKIPKVEIKKPEVEVNTLVESVQTVFPFMEKSLY